VNSTVLGLTASDYLMRGLDGLFVPLVVVAVLGLVAVWARGLLAGRLRLPHVFTRPDAQVRPALVNGAAGVVVTVAGLPFAVMGFTVAEGKIVEIDAITDPERVRRIAAAVLTDE
jgi:hypothetical protein